MALSSIHPLSIEAISPTTAIIRSFGRWNKYPSSVNRGYFSYFDCNTKSADCGTCIHPLSIEAISPTNRGLAFELVSIEYPSSVNRGYFSYKANLASGLT